VVSEKQDTIFKKHNNEKTITPNTGYDRKLNCVCCAGTLEAPVTQVLGIKSRKLEINDIKFSIKPDNEPIFI